MRSNKLWLIPLVLALLCGAIVGFWIMLGPALSTPAPLAVAQDTERND